AFSRNGKWFLTADSFGRILVWNTQVFNFFQGCKIANGNILSRAPDSDILVIGPTLFRNISMPLDTINLSLDYALWNMVEFQPAQERLIFPNRQEAVVYNYEGKAIKRFSGHGALVLGGLFNPTNPDQALTYTENSIHLWDISSGEERVKIDAAHYGGLSTVLWAANGNIIALTKSYEIPFVIWNGAGKLIKEDNSHRGFIKNIALAPDKKYFITSSGKSPMESPFELPDLYGGWMTEDIDYTVKLW
ncbi:MAG: WD40 repeat domain-containing protein, partial [Alphaproteobacteria bacterium]|nr:WD40 repeat domain-containing protein [Alphaproteobacteria bacterium]